MKTFMGIDQSFTKTGYCVIDDKDTVLVYGTLSSAKNDDIFERAWLLAQELCVLEKTLVPTHIALEGLAFSKLGNATRDLAGLQFTIVQQLRYVNKRVVEVVSPMSVKKFATQKGNCDKQMMVEALPENVKIEFGKEYKKTTGLYDVTDAYWIAKYIKENHIK